MASNTGWHHRDSALNAGVDAAAAPSPIVDTPGYHGFFMIGIDTLYLCHMPMFTMEKHMYQVLVRATLPPDAMQQYQAARRANPTAPYNLSNVDAEPYTLPQLKTGQVTSFNADLYSGYVGSEPTEPWLQNVPLQVEQIVHFRHFNFDIPRPDHQDYVLFGMNGEAHLTHYIARDPDYQHIVTLGTFPDWLDPSQIGAGVELTILDLPSQPTPCANPLTASNYSVLYQGWDVVRPTLDLAGAQTLWFSTGNLLNAKDPCAPDE